MTARSSMPVPKARSEMDRESATALAGHTAATNKRMIRRFMVKALTIKSK